MADQAIPRQDGSGGRTRAQRSGRNSGFRGKSAFVIGLVTAVAGGLRLEQAAWFSWTLAALGLIVGFLHISDSLHISDEEHPTFLLAAIALIVVANAIEAIPHIGEIVTPIVANLVLFVGGAVLVVSLGALVGVARD